MSSLPIAALIFDLDGTLIDSRLDIARAANHALAEHGFPTLAADRINQYIGDGAHLLVARAAGVAPSDPVVLPLLDTFLAFYSAHPVDQTTLCAGAAEALDGRLGLPLTLCTNKPRQTTERVLEALHIASAFSVIVAGGDFAKNKPDPAPLLHIAHALELPPSALLMIGDGEQDVLGGRAAGMRTVGVRGGIQGDARMTRARPDALIETLHDLPEAIRRLNA